MKTLMKTLPFVLCLAVASMASGADIIDGLAPGFRVVADDIGLADGTRVAAWTDRVQGVVLDDSTISYDQFPLDDKRPTLKTGVMNGHDVVRFDETTHQQLSARNALLGNFHNLYGQTLIVAFSKPEGEINSVLATYFQNNDAGAVRTDLGIGEMTAHWATVGDPGEAVSVRGAWAADPLDSDYVVPDNTPMWLAVRTNWATQRIIADGVEVASGGTNMPGGIAETVIIGGTEHWSAPISWLTGDVAEVIIFGRNLSAGEIGQVGQYMAATYGMAPEPATMVLLGLGGVALIARRRR